MKLFARFSGVIGFIFMVFGAVASIFFQGELQYAGFTQFGVGVLGIAFFCFYFLGDAFRAIVRRRESIYGALGGVLLLFILIGVNVVSQTKLGEFKIDTTQNKIHTLSDPSKQTLEALNTDIIILSFFEDSRTKGYVRNLIEKYTYESSRIKFKEYDPDKEPTLAEKYDSSGNELIVENTVTGKTVRVEAPSEESITMALRRVTVNKTKRVYFIQGHGEGDLEDDKTKKGLYIAKLLLEREGFIVNSLNLVKNPEVPADADMVAAWGAQRPLSKKEAGALKIYLEKGGRLVIAQDPLLTTTKNGLIKSGLEGLLKDYGLKFDPAVILEQQMRLMQAPVIDVDIPMADFGKHPITKNLSAQTFVQFFISQPVSKIANYKGPAKISPLISTSKASWAETDIASLFIVKKAKADGDRIGPIAVGQIAEWNISKEENKNGILVVYGESDFGLNSRIQSGYNKDLFVNTFNYLAGEVEALTIRPKRWKTSTLELTAGQQRFVYYAGIFVLPEFILCLGLGIWLLRRNRA